MSLADELDALLPQTQCTQCGFDGCRPYAEAMAARSADVNRCPPGGDDGVARLAARLGVAVQPLDPDCGSARPPEVALIDESVCIGCTLCIQACPVDAIVGASKRMHTVLLEDCTGCRLCLPPCPVDCIEMLPVDTLRARGADLSPRPPQTWRDRAAAARGRWRARSLRLVQAGQDRAERLALKAAHKLESLAADDPDAARKRSIIEAAMRRARERRAGTGEPST
ncbi:MAG: RnfABCDGE type electron transport complex subunit B [Burkholderiales bacterium]